MIVSGAAPPMVDALRRVRCCIALRAVACLDASFAVSAMRARECRRYSALSIIAPSVNVLRRTRRKPSTIRGAAPDVVIGQSTAARAGAHPYRPAKWLGPITPAVYTNDSTLTETKAFVSVLF